MEPLSWALSIIAALFIGGFLKPYLGKKGENLATHEDIQKLVDQVKAVTVVTEEIKASISTDAWKRDLKKEACYAFVKQARGVADSLTKLAAKYTRDHSAEKHEAEVEFVTAYGCYLDAEIIIEMIGSRQLQEARKALTTTIMETHGNIKAKDFGKAWDTLAEFTKANEDFLKACRTELGFDE